MKRMRATHRLGSLVYDLERTFILRAPAEEGDLTPWLIEEDLLTDEPPPDWNERSGRLPPITDVSFDLSGACNLACVYCFEDDIHSRLGAMSDATAMEALAFAFAASEASRRLVFHFGSGEPLLRFDLLRRIVDEARRRAEQRKQEIAFDLTTNGTRVTQAMAEFFARYEFHLRLSLDGPAHLQNKNRPQRGGRPSYDQVMRGLAILLGELPDRVIVNSVLALGTRLFELWEWAKTLGIRHYHVIKVGAPNGGDIALDPSEIEEFTSDLDLIADEIFRAYASGTVPLDYLPLTKTIRRLMIPQPITRFCGVAGTYLGVAADGAVFPCFRHIGLPQYHLGDVRSSVDDGLRARFRSTVAADVEHRPVCASCWARYLCGGACYADSAVYGHGSREPRTRHCPFWRTEIETGIRLYKRLAEETPESCLLISGTNPERVC